MSALALAAVGRLGWKSGVTLAADHFVALVGTSESGKRWLDLDATDTTTTKSEDEMESGLLLDVVVGEGTAIFELLTGED